MTTGYQYDLYTVRESLLNALNLTNKPTNKMQTNLNATDSTHFKAIIFHVDPKHTKPRSGWNR